MDILKRLGDAAQACSERRYDDALQAYRDVLDTSESDPTVMYGVAQVELALGVVHPDAEDLHATRAIVWIREAITLDPDRPVYHNFLGTILQQVAPPDYNSAADAIRRALALQPTFVPALDNLASLYGVPEDVVSLEDAIACCERAVQICPARSRWNLLAQLYQRSGRLADHQQALKESYSELSNTKRIVY